MARAKLAAKVRLSEGNAKFILSISKWEYLRTTRPKVQLSEEKNRHTGVQRVKTVSCYSRMLTEPFVLP